jgi:hypothetical protein
MPRRPVTPPPSPKISVILAGNVITVTDGNLTRKSSCATQGSAKGLASRLNNDPVFARRWMHVKEPKQLALALEGGG